MCELLIRTQDRGCGQWFAGDVVAVQADGWKWGLAEYGAGAHPFWRVVKVPGVPASVFNDMLEPVMDKQGTMRLGRKKHFGALTKEPTLLELNAARLIKTGIK